MTDKAIRKAAWVVYGVTLPSFYCELVRAKRMRLSEAVREFLIDG